ncbi:MAG: acyltransferase, partial [Planctomycetota bacterium]
QYFEKCNLEHLNPNFLHILIGTVSSIHIPVFMLTAGIVLAMSGSQIRTLADYYRFEYKKFLRLMLPYISISVMQLAIETAAPIGGFPQTRVALANMVLIPMQAPAGHLWFLYCLMCIFLIWPIFSSIKTKFLHPILLAGMVMLAILPIPWPKSEAGTFLFGLRELTWFLPMFAVGYWYGLWLVNPNRRNLLPAILAGCACAAAMCYRQLVPLPEDFVGATLWLSIRLAGYIGGGLCILWLCDIINTWTGRICEYLAGIGLRSYDIYLLHVGLVGQPLVFALSMLHPGMVTTYILFILATIATLLVPMLIGEIIRRIPSLAFIMLGIPIRKNPKL